MSCKAVRDVHRVVLPLSSGHCCAAMEVTLADGELHELQEGLDIFKKLLHIPSIY